MSEPLVMDIRTEPAAGKAESSRAQFRELFMLHEPAIFKFSDSMLEAFGRGSIKSVKIFCEVLKMVYTPVEPSELLMVSFCDRR